MLPGKKYPVISSPQIYSAQLNSFIHKGAEEHSQLAENLLFQVTQNMCFNFTTTKGLKIPVQAGAALHFQVSDTADNPSKPRVFPETWHAVCRHSKKFKLILAEKRKEISEAQRKRWRSKLPVKKFVMRVETDSTALTAVTSYPSPVSKRAVTVFPSRSVTSPQIIILASFLADPSCPFTFFSTRLLRKR